MIIELQKMKNSVILLALIALSGCASTQNVVNNIPAAAGSAATTVIFGGTISANPDPVEYIAEDINREGRVTYNGTRRKMQSAIAESIAFLLGTAK